MFSTLSGILNNRTLAIEGLEQAIQIDYINMHIDLIRHWKKHWHAAMLNKRLKLTVEIMAFLFCHVAVHNKWSSTLGFFNCGVNFYLFNNAAMIFVK